MTNEKPKEKIMKIIDESVDAWAIRDKRGRIHVHIDKLADALIAAGIGDTKAAVREFAGVLQDKIFREHSLGTKGYIVGFKEMKERALADVDALVKEVCGDD